MVDVQAELFSDIGTLLPAKQELANAGTLLKTVFVLHRAQPLSREER